MNKNDISIKAVDGILDHGKKHTFFPNIFKKSPDIKITQKEFDIYEKDINEKIKNIEKNIYEKNIEKSKQDNNTSYLKKKFDKEIKKLEEEKEQLEKDKDKVKKEIKEEDNSNQIIYEKKDLEIVKESNPLSLTSLFNEITTGVNNSNPVKKFYNNKDNYCFDQDNFSNLMNLTYKIVFFVIVIFIILIFVFSILNLILILYYVINDIFNIFFNHDYILGYTNSYKIIIDMITSRSNYLYINSAEELVFNNFIIIIIIIFIILFCHLYAFLKRSSCMQENKKIKGKINIDNKYIFILFILFLFLLLHFIIFKYFYGYIVNIYIENFKKQMDMSRKIGDMIGKNVNQNYINLFTDNTKTYDDINNYIYKNNILNNNNLSNYLLVFTMFDYFSNVDKNLLSTYIKDNTNNNFFELLPIKNTSLVKKNYLKLTVLDIDKYKNLNIKNISEEIMILNNNIKDINKFIIENGKISYPSYLILIYCLLIIFLFIITYLSIYFINFFDYYYTKINNYFFDY